MYLMSVIISANMGGSHPKALTSMERCLIGGELILLMARIERKGREIDPNRLLGNGGGFLHKTSQKIEFCTMSY